MDMHRSPLAHLPLGGFQTDFVPPIPAMQLRDTPTLGPKPVVFSRRRRVATAAIMVAAVGCTAGLLVADHHATGPDAAAPASNTAGTPELELELVSALAGKPTGKRPCWWPEVLRLVHVAALNCITRPLALTFMHARARPSCATAPLLPLRVLLLFSRALSPVPFGPEMIFDLQ